MLPSLLHTAPENPEDPIEIKHKGAHVCIIPYYHYGIHNESVTLEKCLCFKKKSLESPALHSLLGWSDVWGLIESRFVDELSFVFTHASWIFYRPIVKQDWWKADFYWI